MPSKEAALINRLEQEIPLRIAVRILSKIRQDILFSGGFEENRDGYMALLHAECHMLHPARLKAIAMRETEAT